MCGDHVVDYIRRKLKKRVAKELYAEMAYWKPYRKLNAVQRAAVREAVYLANIQ
jgi:hypothetical protein